MPKLWCKRWLSFVTEYAESGAQRLGALTTVVLLAPEFTYNGLSLTELLVRSSQHSIHLSGGKLGDLLSQFRSNTHGREPTCRTNKFFTFLIYYGNIPRL